MPYPSRTILAVSVCLCGTLPAQEPKLGPRSFFPPEYTSELFVDVARLIDTPIWDTAERSLVFGPVRTSFRAEYGFRMEDIRTLRITQRSMRAPRELDPRRRTVAVLEGRDSLVVPAAGGRIEHQEIAGHAVALESSTTDDDRRLYVRPRPGCLVIGDEWLIRSALEGKRRGGVMSGELMGLVTRRRPLAYYAIDVPQPDDPDYGTDAPFDTAWLSQHDPLQNLVVYLDVDEATTQTTIRATMRFENGRVGPARLEKNLRASLDQQAASPWFAPAKRLLDAARWQRDGVDLAVTVPLGDRRDVDKLFGELGGLAPLLFLTAAPAPPIGVAAPAPPVKVAEPARTRAVPREDKAKPASRPTGKRKTDR